jgi:mono/diheme cytochrome c family protein
VVLIITVSIRWDRTFDYPVQNVTVSMDPAAVARGEYLYQTVSVCGACHSAGGEENPELLPTGGRKFDISELGVVYTPNITPAQETGIGGWTDGEVIRAIREGVGKDGRFLVLMPSELFNGMSDEDVQAIVAYLKLGPRGKRDPKVPAEPTWEAAPELRNQASGPHRQPGFRSASRPHRGIRRIPGELRVSLRCLPYSPGQGRD